ncbi:unnamed protein product [Chrysoparadoxa australica]
MLVAGQAVVTWRQPKAPAYTTTPVRSPQSKYGVLGSYLKALRFMQGVDSGVGGAVWWLRQWKVGVFQDMVRATGGVIHMHGLLRSHLILSFLLLLSNKLDIVQKEVTDDPTLQRSHNAVCEKCNYSEAVFFQADEGAKSQTLSLIFVCCHCGHKWTA